MLVNRSAGSKRLTANLNRSQLKDIEVEQLDAATLKNSIIFSKNKTTLDITLSPKSVTVVKISY